MITVGFSNTGCRRIKSATLIIVNVLPEPWVCQIRPVFFSGSSARSTTFSTARVAGDCGFGVAFRPVLHVAGLGRTAAVQRSLAHCAEAQRRRNIWRRFPAALCLPAKRGPRTGEQIHTADR